MIQSISASTFINALVRFHSRRPGLRVLWSDHGTNFRGADRVLQKATQKWNEEVGGALRLRGVEWKYIPPHAPHCGGAWERLIQIAKKHISTLVSSPILQVDVFATVLVEVERIMNSRPLTYASTEISDISVLTPNDFLYPGVLTQTSTNILPPSPPGGQSLRYQWQRVRTLIDCFWDRWTNEYVHTLQTRTKWQRSTPNLYEGQLVLLVEDNLPRDQWRLGRIVTVGARGGKVRTAVVKTAQGRSLERHVTKLVGLELDVE